ncbi:hypothetical protein ACN47E_010121 [Coniothyrium glycines]
MSDDVLEAQSRPSAEFAESSVLEAIVPARLDVNLEEELTSWQGTLEEDGGSILPFLPQRQVLLLDELLSVLVVFRTPLLEDTLLKAYLARLSVNVEAFAFSTAPPPEGDPKTAPPKELIHSEIIPETSKSIIVQCNHGEATYTYVIWKVDIFMARPQGRFHKPAVYFQPSASFKPAEKPGRDDYQDDYLPSRVPTAINLLQSFENDPALAGIHTYLSAMRINKVTPSAPVVRELTRPIRNGQRLLFRVLPALIWRIRYSRPQSSLSDLSLIASLDVEVAQFGSYNVRIDKIDLALHGGTVKEIGGMESAPILHKPGDQLTYLYKIKPDQRPDGSTTLTKGHCLILHVKANVVISETCQPNIAIEWKTPVDFANEQAASVLKAAHRLSHPLTHDSTTANPDALPAHDSQTQQEREAETNSIGITLTITGPPKVQVGKLFSWDVFIVNRSAKVRKLAILVIAKRKRDYDRHKAQPSASSIDGAKVDRKDLVTSAILDENIVYAKHKSAKTETAELVCLTTDIRLGQLSPGSCYTAALKFLALSAGVLSVESVRVIDLATNETADIRELPSIVAEEAE